MNKIIICPCKIRWFEWGYRGSRMVRHWFDGIAVATTETTVLVWSASGRWDGHPRFCEIPKERIKVAKP